MKIELLAAELAGAGLGEPGKTLFVHHMPAECKEGILLRLPLDGVHLNHELPGYIKTSIQAIVRSTGQAPGNAKAKAVSAALTCMGKAFLDPETGEEGLFVNYMRPATLPIVYPRSDGNGLEWSINFDCCIVIP